MIVLHNVLNSYTNERIRNRLKMRSVNNKHIRIRRNLDQYFCLF